MVGAWLLLGDPSGNVPCHSGAQHGVQHSQWSTAPVSDDSYSDVENIRVHAKGAGGGQQTAVGSPPGSGREADPAAGATLDSERICVSLPPPSSSIGISHHESTAPGKSEAFLLLLLVPRWRLGGRLLLLVLGRTPVATSLATVNKYVFMWLF